MTDLNTSINKEMLDGVCLAWRIYECLLLENNAKRLM